MVLKASKSFSVFQVLFQDTVTKNGLKIKPIKAAEFNVPLL